MITTLLRKLGATSAVPAIAAFVDHPNFFVRWHVMRDLIGLDPIAALPHLTHMAAGDPHPETREAARRTLVRLREATMRKAA
jgi:HEAT repeat protein